MAEKNMNTAVVCDYCLAPLNNPAEIESHSNRNPPCPQKDAVRLAREAAAKGFTEHRCPFCKKFRVIKTSATFKCLNCGWVENPPSLTEIPNPNPVVVENGSEFHSLGASIGALVAEKNAVYGDSFAKCGEFLRLLYPSGIAPEQYGDALALVRIFDKQMRIATRKSALGESPYKDIAGYGILGAAKDAKEKDRG